MKAKAYIVHYAMCEPELEWRKPKYCLSAEPLYTSPPKRERVVFPTMLRKMWSGGEVQAWLDENVNGIGENK
jgi:hypothetical protein